MNERSADSATRGPATVIAAVIVLAVFVLAIAGTATTVNDRRAERRMSIAEASQAFEVLESLRQAAAEIAMERGGLYAALHAPIPATPEQHRETIARRAHIDDLLSRAGETLQVSENGRFGASRIARAMSRLRDMRQQVDQALAMTRQERPPDLADTWFRTTTDAVLSLQQALVATHNRISHANPGSHLALDLQRHIWKVTDFAGKERALIAAAATTRQALAHNTRQRLNWYRNRLVQEWNVIESLAMNTAGDPVREEIARARTRFFNDYERTREAMVLASPKGAYPLNATDWFSKSTEAIRSVYTLGSIAGTHAARRQDV